MKKIKRKLFAMKKALPLITSVCSMITLWVAIVYWIVRIIHELPSFNVPTFIGVIVIALLACYSTWETFRERGKMRDEV